LLSNHYYVAKVRCGDTNFYASLDECVKIHGRTYGWRQYIAQLKGVGDGSFLNDWVNDKLIFIPVFIGPTEAGHWTLLVIDRTREGNYLAVFFDSLPSFSKGVYQHLQEILQHTPWIDDSYTWINATVPMQWKCSNDCGVFMCCIASLYTLGLEKQSLLSQEPSPQPRVNDVELVLNKETGMWGYLGRQHMYHTLKNSTFNIKDQFLQSDEHAIVWKEST